MYGDENKDDEVPDTRAGVCALINMKYGRKNKIMILIQEKRIQYNIDKKIGKSAF